MCAVRLVGQLTEPAYAGDSLSSSADYSGRSLNFLIYQYNHLAHEYNELSDNYAKLKAVDDKALKLIEIDNHLIAQADAALGIADRALSMPPSVALPFVLPAPVQPFELHCATSAFSFGTSTTAYTNCH